MKKISILLVFVLSALAYSCTEDTLEPSTDQNKDAESGIANVNDLLGVANGMYNQMTQPEYYGRDFIIYGEVRSDNCYANGASGRFLTPAAMKMGTTDANANDTWARIYKVIGIANLIISKADANLPGDEVVKKQIVGQAYAIRALAHFDLLKLYGQQHVTGNNTVGIPYIKEFRGVNITPARNTVDEVKGFIYEDLTVALTYLDPALDFDDDVFGATPQQFVSTYAVEAIRARVAIYFGDWATAKTACEAVISGGKYQIVPAADYAASFAADGPVNSIFELAYSNTDNSGNSSISFIYRGTAYGDIRVLDNLKAIFDPGDVRNDPSMIDLDLYSSTSDGKQLTNIGKYPQLDYSSEIFILRYEEVVLNYAEALFRINPNDPVALNTLNSITSKRGALPYTVINEDNILKERRRELCFEGFRFDDLARTHRDIPFIDDINQRFGATVSYGSYNFAFPIPKNETNSNSNCTQNLGYI